MLESILESVVSNLLSSAVAQWKKSRRPEFQDFDFVIEREDGSRTAIEVLGGYLADRRLSQLSARLANRDGVDDFILVTAEAPTPEQQQFFAAALSTVDIPIAWYGINDLPGVLGLDSPGDLRTAKGLEALQMAALVSNAKSYELAPVGVTGPLIPQPRSVAQVRELPVEYRQLSRQFPFRRILELYQADKDLTDLLGLGHRVSAATIVLSDIKNFSSLVKAARPEDLRDIMTKYYLKSRDLVWDRGGVLDKFIGDAVLAVFGYPSGEGGAKEALGFSMDLVVLGQELLQGFADGMNEIVPTGTRVGMTTGDLWPLNIGRSEIELSFVGDVINLAARLEKNCMTDGVLLSNTTRLALLRSDSELLDKLDLQERILSPDDMKGQNLDIRAWQLPPALPRSPGNVVRPKKTND